MRQHYQNAVKAGNAPKVTAQVLRSTAPPVRGLSRSTVVLSAQLIEAFVDKYLAHKYDNPLPTPPFHREIWEACADVAATHVLILAPRGHAKSTAVTEAYGLSALLFRIRDFAVIISNTLGQSVEFLRDFKTELLENEELISDFGIKGLVKETEDDIIVEMLDGHKFRVVARGSEQKVRGLKWNKRRPNLILCDDLEDDEQVASPERREKFSKWFMRAVLPFGSDDCIFRVSATILHFDSLAENLSKDETWKVLRYRAHKSFDDFSELLWPEKFNAERLLKIRAKFIKKGDRDGYSQEYLNYPIAEGSGIFRKEDLLPITPDMRGIPLRYVCAWDLAIGLKQANDYTVCVVVGIDSKGRRHVVDVRRDRWAGDEIIEEMFAVQQAYPIEVHYVEDGQITKTIGPFLYTAMREREFYFNVETRTPVLDKVARAASWRAETRAHNVYYDQEASWWEALLEEMTRFPKGEHDDQVDPQSLLGLELAGLLRANTMEEQAEDEYQELMARVAPAGRSLVTGY